jgi:hypothetical protein
VSDTPNITATAASSLAHASWAKTADRSARTAPGGEKFMDRFEREVDPEGVLPPHDRYVRAEHAKKSYFKRLAVLSAQSRRKAAAERKGGAA